MPRALWQDPFAAQAIDLLQEPSRARAEAVRQIGNANARAAETAGAANANAQLQSGAAWANGIQQVGGAIAAIPGNIQQLQAQSRAEQMQKLQLTQAQRQNDAQQRLEETRRNIGALMNDPSIINEDGTFNGKGILAKLSSALPNGASGPVQAPDPSIVFGIIDPINESLMRSRKLEMEFNEHKTNTIAQLASSILKLGEKSGNYLENAQLGLAAAVKSGVINQEQANSFLLPMVERPEIVPTLLANIAARSTLKPPAPTIMKPGEVAFDPTTHAPIPGMAIPEKPERPIEVNPGNQLVGPNGQVIFTAPPKPEPQKSLQSENVLLDGKPAKVNFHPDTGKYTSTSGEDVSDRVKPIPPQSSVVVQQNQSEAKAIADAIVSGDQPPDMRSLYRLAGPIRAELAKSGYNLTNASLDWEATKKHVLSLNSAQQLKLNQSIGALPELLDSVDALASQWKGGRFPVLNKGNLALAKNGIYGEDVASVARKLDQQIADVTADLGNVYMGGNSPTDHALKLAGTALSGEWSEKVLHDMVDLAKKNVTIRQNSMRNTGVAGASANNPYAPPAAITPPSAPAGRMRVIGPNGQTGTVPSGTTLPDGWRLQ